MERLPSVAAVRPAKCPRCGAASQEPGRCLVIHGQGKVRRQQWGPRIIGGAPEVTELILRLYECQRCFAVIRVGPRGLIEHQRYAAAAIAMALCLWLIDRLPQTIVRARVSPWFRRSKDADAERRWRSLSRWSSKISAGQLWAELSAHASDVVMATLRALAALIPGQGLGVPLHQLAFAGAAHHRRGPSAM